MSERERERFGGSKREIKWEGERDSEEGRRRLKQIERERLPQSLRGGGGVEVQTLRVREI